MPAYFFDSSALVKRYHRERGTVWVQAICEPRAHPPLYISQLAEVEVVAALHRVGRHEQLHPSFTSSMVGIFQRHLTLSAPSRQAPIYLIIPMAPAITELAATLCTRYWDVAPHPLRSLDAIQLACALAAAAAETDELIFVTADARLATIAPQEGLRTVNPSYPPTP